MASLDGSVEPVDGACVRGLHGGRWWWATALVLMGALLATLPTTGDLGLTWDEPAYRHSQIMSGQWWERLAGARGWDEVARMFEPDTLLYYWPYGRFGTNFHPPLAGQLDLLTYELFGRWVKDIPARRLASVFEYALTITLAFGFLARRYGFWVGAVAAGALLLMPRVYGDGHIAGTDTPGLLLWAATALAFWKGLYEPGARRWRIAVGILVGLAFVEKMAAVLVVLPILGWLVATRLPRLFAAPPAERRADAIDGLATGLALLAPLAFAFGEILRLAKQLPHPAYTDLFRDPPASQLPGAILAVPCLIWGTRQLLARLFPRHPVWGVERPALEIGESILAFAPLVGWLGNPAWWRETFPRLAHYYLLNKEREGALPAIRIFYLGQTYVYSLPWHNAWVLIGVTVPATLLAAALLGILFALTRGRRDPLPLYFLVHLVTLPALRMLPTPGHDGVRLFLPAFFFLAAMAGWGTAWAADLLARPVPRAATALRALLAVLVLGPAAWQLVAIHPFELSYYNELIGGPRGAWRRGFELSYWYDAFNPGVLGDLNDERRGFPRGAVIDLLNPLTITPTLEELHTLGELRGDLRLWVRDPDVFPYVWLLTHDSKATPFTRLLFAMRPWYALRPRQLDGLRVVTVADPAAVSRAWALELLASGVDARAAGSKDAPAASRGRRRTTRLSPPTVNEPFFRWAGSDPEGLRAAARKLAGGEPAGDDPGVRRLRSILGRLDRPGKPGGLFSERLLKARPEALIEAVEIVIRRPGAVRTVLTRFGYTDPDTIGGYLDRDLPDAPPPHGRGATVSCECAPVPCQPASAPDRAIGPTTRRASKRAATAMAQASV